MLNDIFFTTGNGKQKNVPAGQNLFNIVKTPTVQYRFCEHYCFHSILAIFVTCTFFDTSCKFFSDFSQRYTLQNVGSE
jgi:hypothetical protein